MIISQIKNKKGFTLVEILIGSFLALLVFSAIFFAYQLALRVVAMSKNKVVAAAIASSEIEKIRNLDYHSVGIKGGYPDGILDAVEEVNINGFTYIVEREVSYVADPEDGLSSPEDECPNDYKKIRVKVSWQGITKGEVALYSDIVPNTLSEECSETGGILSVSVFNSSGELISSPTIEVKDPQTKEIIKVANPSSGQHYFPLPAGIYEVEASKEGYSFDKTYSTDEVAIPQKPNIKIIENKTSEASFSIDKVSSFSVNTLSPWGIDYFFDSFINQDKISEITNLSVQNGEVSLITGALSGSLVSIPIEPGENLISWDKFSFNNFLPSGTQIVYHILYFNGENWVFVSDSDLSGNSIGFSDEVDLSGLDVLSYQAIKIQADFSSENSSTSPVLYDWQISWKTNIPTAVANVEFNLKGEKIIGKDANEDFVYKFSKSFISDSAGYLNISGLEWDNYTFSIDSSTGLDLKETNPSPMPISLLPDSNVDIQLYVEAQNSLLVSIQDVETGDPIFAANVRVYNSDLTYDLSLQTNRKGQAYFIPLESGDYTLEISMSGYAPESQAFSISGDKSIIISLTRIE